jgi:carbon-monoxide dehydrogenase medium subunit
MKLRLAAPTHLIDISRCAELLGVREEGGRIHIGAATTYHALEKHPLVADKAPLVGAVARQVADMQVRSKGTIGGSLCNSDPNADMPVGLLALDAMLHVRSLTGSRVLPIAGWFRGIMSTALQPGEILASISVDPSRDTARSAYVKVKHPASRFGVACAAVNLAVGGDGGIQRAAVAIGGLGDVPARLDTLEAALAGRAATDTTLGAALERHLAPFASSMPPARQWLLRVAAGAVQKALAQCTSGRSE